MTKKDKDKDNSDNSSPTRPVVRFAILFLLMILVVAVVFSQLFTRYHDNMLWLMEGTATVCGSILVLFSDHANYSGVNIQYHGFSVEIIDECTGLFEMLIYIAAVLAFSTTFKNKLIGFAIGLPAILIFNIVRITLLLVVGASSWTMFNFMHLYLWQITLIIMIASVWIIWLYLVVFREKKVVAVSG
jgi:archaeosortase B (VPXXXP-CTERM-specific)